MASRNGTITFIANPKSGATSRKRLSQQFYSYLLECGYHVRFAPTTAPGHACDLAREAAHDEGCTHVVVAGGDGTIREAAEGLQGSDTPLLIVPSGTENLLAGELGYDERLRTVIETFEEGFIRPLDLGMINGQCFICVVGVGFDADVVDRVHRNRSGHIDYFDYIDPIWQAFCHHRFLPIQVLVDGEEIYCGPGMAFVGNVARFAGGLKILHQAHYGDGLLDICVFKCNNRPHLVKHALFTMAQQHDTFGDVIYQQGQRVTIRAYSPTVKSEVDGDPGPELPIRITT
ncbi:diacylglycerol/lipid kinase family protein, partial [Planctomycetota bacterium]